MLSTSITITEAKTFPF